MSTAGAIAAMAAVAVWTLEAAFILSGFALTGSGGFITDGVSNALTGLMAAGGGFWLAGCVLMMAGEDF